jgi:sterol desaturase/sphingolipid hydroxylase (fatty acid hydroxylase superfamily)
MDGCTRSVHSAPAAALCHVGSHTHYQHWLRGPTIESGGYMRHTHPWMLTIPGFLILAATLEGWWLSRRDGTYDWKAYFSSAGDMAVRMAVGLLPLGLAAGLLYKAWDYRFYTMPLNEAWPWVLLFIGQDLCYYWMHRADHRVRWLWATHSVHHSPDTLNLSAAYRLGWTARLSIGPVFFAPLVLMGFSPLVVGGALAANLFYQFWLHATWIPRLGPLEWVFNTPAHHRVHHASNPEYLDSNFGGVLIVFDRLFGALVEERAGVILRYGLVQRIDSYNPWVLGTHEWRAILRDLVAARSWRQVVRATLGSP